MWEGGKKGCVTRSPTMQLIKIVVDAIYEVKQKRGWAIILGDSNFLTIHVRSSAVGC